MQNEYFPAEKITAIREYLLRAQHIVIVTHMSPDGDAMGSALGMWHFLNGKWKMDNGGSVTVIVPNRFPAFFRWMPGVENVVIYDEQQAEADRLIEEADLLICTDFNDPKRIGQVGNLLLQKTCPKVLIDHHLFPADFADVTLSYPESPSASELVCKLIRSLSDYTDREMATCLYTGMMTDTGNFSFNSNYPEMYETVAELVRMGVDKDAVYNAVFNAHSADRMRLVGYSLYQKMSTSPDGATAAAVLSARLRPSRTPAARA